MAEIKNRGETPIGYPPAQAVLQRSEQARNLFKIHHEGRFDDGGTEPNCPRCMHAVRPNQRDLQRQVLNAPEKGKAMTTYDEMTDYELRREIRPLLLKVLFRGWIKNFAGIRMAETGRNRIVECEILHQYLSDQFLTLKSSLRLQRRGWIGGRQTALRRSTADAGDILLFRDSHETGIVGHDLKGLPAALIGHGMINTSGTPVHRLHPESQSLGRRNPSRSGLPNWVKDYLNT